VTPILQRLVIEAYRGVTGLELNELSPVSLIVGANNAGKTSILEAAALALRPDDLMQWISAVRYRDVDLALVDGLWSMFPGSRALLSESGSVSSPRLALKATLGGRERTIGARCTVTPFWARIGADSDLVLELSPRLEVEIDRGPTIVLMLPGATPPLKPSFNVLSVTPGTHYSTKAIITHLSRAVEEGRKKLAVDLLRIFDPDVEDLDVVLLPRREAVRVTHAKRGVVDFSSFGDGMRASAALALALARASQGVLLIDEIDTGIHKHMLRPVLKKVFDAALSTQVQVLATTHSLEAVDALLEAAGESATPEALSAFWVKPRDGRHEVRPYGYERLLRMREGGLDIR